MNTTKEIGKYSVGLLAGIVITASVGVSAQTPEKVSDTEWKTPIYQTRNKEDALNEYAQIKKSCELQLSEAASRIQEGVDAGVIEDHEAEAVIELPIGESNE